MPVSLPPTFDLWSEHEFHTHVSGVIAAAVQAGCPFFSLGTALPPIDPLRLMAVLMQVSDQPDHFYLEQPHAGDSVAACGRVVAAVASGKRRFQELQRFCEHTLGRIWTTAPAEPRVFCQFAFGDGATTTLNRAFLPRWQIIQRHGQAVLTLNGRCDTVNSPEVALWEDWQLLWRAVASVLESPPVCPPPLAIALPGLADQSRAFMAGVNRALELLEEGRLEKLVLACTTTVEQPTGFNWLGTLHNLRQQYHNCYVFSVGQHWQDVFLGASPERLVRIENGLLWADALAGSRPRGQTDHEDQRLRQGLYHSPKERHEHHVIVEFLCQTLYQLGMTCEFPSEPRILELSNIQHLQTLIQARMGQPTHILDIVAALHPTPAVAGYPRAVAREWLSHLEQFDRNGYAAPLGWVTPQGEGEFIVGIRSAHLQGQRAHLFAGAGIVQGSQPEREWQEILLKLQAMVSALA
ncbi:isochorismate synthase [Thermosynechococcaceae cyanobacterium Okahandja]